jgi:general secretion pathway protein D
MKSRVLFLITFTLVFLSYSAMQGISVTLDTKDNDIRDVLAGLAKANSTNLLMSNSVQGRISISLSNVPFMKAVEMIAKSSGFLVETFDNTVVVGKSEDIKGLLPKTSKVIQLQYATANELKQALSGTALEGIELVADQRTNSILATGLDRDIKRFEEIVKLLDVAIPSKPQSVVSMKIFPLKYANAVSIQKTIADLCTPMGKANIDERTNSLIVTDQPAVFDKISEIIAQLDIETDEEKEKATQAQTGPAPPPVLLTQVFNLNYTEGSVIKPIIQTILTTNGKVESFMKRKDIVIVETMSGGNSGGGSGSSGKSTSGMENFYKERWSDAIVVTDIPEVIEKVTALIAELDVKSLQVRIEAKIVEVELTGRDQLGVSWSAVHKPSGSSIDGFFPVIADNSLMEVNLGTMSTEYFKNVMVKLQALESKGQAKLLSNPSVIGLDNELAQMIVADKIPLITTYESQFSSSTKVEFINIGVMLNVIPHITDDGYILVDTLPIVDSIKQWTSGANPQPIISSRVAHCRVRVKDGETFVIGGLVKEENIDAAERIPILGKIPLIGRLFGTTDNNKTKTDLMVFITTKLIKDDGK